MKTVLKHLAIVVSVIVVIFSVLFAFDDKTRTKTRTFYEEQPLVYITNTGECYHSYGCQYLSTSKISIGLYQAESRGYRCCSVCNGWTFETMQIEKAESYEVVDYPLAIFRCFALSAFIILFVYAPISKLLEKMNGYQDK